MKILTVYIENSVIGGYFDTEFEEPTKNYLNISLMEITNQ
jgi:hypothetical protein